MVLALILKGSVYPSTMRFILLEICCLVRAVWCFETGSGSHTRFEVF